MTLGRDYGHRLRLTEPNFIVATPVYATGRTCGDVRLGPVEGVVSAVGEPASNRVIRIADLH